MAFMRCRKKFCYPLLLFWCSVILIVSYYLLDSPADYSRSLKSTRFLEYQDCQPLRNVVFLKVHKCASSTIANLIVRRGLYHDRAIFALPKQDPAHIGWPNSLLPKHVLHPTSKKPNIMAHHFIYNRTTLNITMPNSTVYISMIRQPFSQFQSIMHYFKEVKQLGLKSYDKASEFLKSPGRYEKKVRMYINVSPPAYFSLTRNVMSREFGLANSDMDNRWKIDKFVEKIDKEFNLVMIYEYFYESIVLLRRLLCWRFRDVVFRKVNFKFDYTVYDGGRARELYRRWSLADHLLYQRLNTSLWSKIRTQNSDFHEEVNLLRQVVSEIKRYCTRYDNLKNVGMSGKSSPLRIEKSKFSDAFSVSTDDCDLMMKRPDNFYHEMLRSNYNWPQTIWIYVYHQFFKFL